jgi:FMN reductase (NADPH)
MELEKSMEYPTLDLIHRHASVRRYKADPLPASVIEAIVAAGQHASTSSNLQTYSVIAVTEAAKRERLAKLCGEQKHIQEAPVFLAFCADRARLERICQLRGYTQVTGYVENFLVAAVDAAILAQNTALAAESLGLGICYIGSIRNNLPEVIDLLELPRLVIPITGMTVGWPDVEPRLRPRLPLRAVLHWEKYDTASEDGALREYDRAMVATAIYKGRQVPVPGKEGEMEEYSWTEHSARRVSQPLRTGLRAVLEEQGFGLE